MLSEVYMTVYRGLVSEEAEEVDMLMVLLGSFIALLATVVTAIVALPALLGDEYQSLPERVWKYKFIYVGYAAVAVGLLGYFRYGYPQLVSGGMAAGVIVAYGALVGTVRYSDVSVNVPGLNRLDQVLGGAAPDEFEVPMDRVDDKGEDSPRRPMFDKGESTLVVGSSRSGKTSALKLLGAQLDHSETAVFAHGSIGEYAEYFENDLGMEVIRIGVRDSTARWNLFAEAESERDLELIARGLFGTNEEYWETSARQVFAALLKVIARENQFSSPSHEELRQAVHRSSADETYRKLREYPDLKSAAEHIDPGAEKQQQGIWSHLVQVVNDVFVDDFARRGEFTLSEYIENPDGRVVVFESPEVSQGVGPMYRVIIDQAIERAMRSSRDGFMLLDEVDTLPRLRNLGDLAARGLAQDTRMLLGVQTVGQLRDVYGASVDGVIGNCNQVIGMTPGNDAGGDTVEFYQSLLGERQETISSVSRSRDAGVGGGDVRISKSEQFRERTPVDAHTMNQWEKGECLVVRRGDWWTGKLTYYGDVKSRYL